MSPVTSQYSYPIVFLVDETTPAEEDLNLNGDAVTLPDQRLDVLGFYVWYSAPQPITGGPVMLTLFEEGSPPFFRDFVYGFNASTGATYKTPFIELYRKGTPGKNLMGRLSYGTGVPAGARGGVIVVTEQITLPEYMPEPSNTPTP